MSADVPDLTSLLVRMQQGDAEAANRALDLLYDELHKMAASQMRREARHHTLQPTALVAEAYLRLKRGPEVINDRRHFHYLAAQAMERVVVDYARQKRAEKRGGDQTRVTLDGLADRNRVDIDIIDLNDALDELGRHDPRAREIVQLKFFGGHTDQEVCEILGENFAKVRRTWVFARSWLKTRLLQGARA